MNKIYEKSILTVVIIGLYSCVFDKDDHKLKLYNNSGKTYFNIVLKDTNLKPKDVDFITEKMKYRMCQINDTAYPLFVRLNKGGYVRKINKEGLDSSLYLYLFETDSVKKYGWNTIVDKRMYFRSKYKVKQLDSINWVIHLNNVGKSRSEIR